MSDKAFRKYLNHYAEAEIQLLESFPDRSYRNVLVIPAHMETTAFIERLETNPLNSNYLLILVSNNPSEIDSDRYQQSLNYHQQIADYLEKPCWINQHLSLHPNNGFDVLLVNRTGNLALPKKQGVGLARKIGADIALYLSLKNRIKSRWIMSSDADALLPRDYFELNEDRQVCAVSYPFSHICDESAVGKATALYESSIKHYVNGLKRAGSSYAYHSLGSALAFDITAYAQVRGFPKRSAGEDFYLLNKIAKLGPVLSPDTPEIQIIARQSSRAPFGTGPAVQKLMQADDMNTVPLFYDPKIFAQLASVFECLSLKRPTSFADISLPDESLQILRLIELDKAMQHAVRQQLESTQYDHHMRSWMDGFRTLKYVHLMRDQFFPNLSYQELSDSANDLTYH